MNRSIKKIRQIAQNKTANSTNKNYRKKKITKSNVKSDIKNKAHSKTSNKSNTTNNDKKTTKSTIAIIAGNGKLPIIVANKLHTDKKNFIILSLDGNNSKILSKLQYDVFKISLQDAKNIINIIKRKKVSKIVCCGGIRFPGMKNIKLSNIFSPKILKYIIKVIFAKQKGDNFLLTIVEKIFNSFECKVIPVQDIVPNILCNKDDNINEKIATSYVNDINYGVNILNALSKFDIGQSIVVNNGRTIGIEGAEGTAELIKRCGKYYAKNLINKRTSLSRGVKRPILIKMCKIGQSRKIDIPTIGIDTVKDAIANNFAGMVIEHNSVIVLDREEIKRTIEKNNNKSIRKKFFIKIYKSN